MGINGLPIVALSMLLSNVSMPSHADELRDFVLTQVDSLLQTGESQHTYTGAHTGKLSLPFMQRDMTLSYTQTQKQGSRKWMFPTNLGNIDIATSLTLNQETSELSYAVIQRSVCDASIGMGVHKFSSPELSFSGNIGNIQGSFSRIEKREMYDPFLSLQGNCDIPLSSQLDVYAQGSLQEGIYTRTGNIEAGLQYELGDPVTLSGGLGIDHFQVKTSDAVTQIVSTYLDTTSLYIAGAFKYTSSETFFLEAQGRHYPENGDTTLSLTANYKF